MQVTETEEVDTEVEVEHEVSCEAQKEAEVAKEAETEAENAFDLPEKDDIPARPIPTPFPQRQKKPAKNIRNDEILELFKQVKINNPILDTIKQIISYAKFLKDLWTIKRRLSVQNKAFLTNKVSSIIQQNKHAKYN